MKETEKTVLINISNHPSDKWGEEQREGIDKIIDIPFPNIFPHYNIYDINYLAEYKLEKIEEILEIEKEEGLRGIIYIMLQGEYSLCYILYEKIKNMRRTKYDFCEFAIKFAIPITERIVKEEIQPDGTVNKVSIFKFSGWRIF